MHPLKVLSIRKSSWYFQQQIRFLGTSVMSVEEELYGAPWQGFELFWDKICQVTHENYREIYLGVIPRVSILFCFINQIRVFGICY